MTIAAMTLNGKPVDTSIETSTCSFCGADLFLRFDTWWDGNGWEGDACNGKPWHMHTPVAS